MADDWKYGDVVRRAVTMNPVLYTRIMFIGPTRWKEYFIGVTLTELPPPAVGTAWVGNPKPGDIRKTLRRSLYEKEPND